MEIKENVKATGVLTIIRRNAEGKITEAITVPNLVVTVGKNYIASRMADNTSTIMSNMAIGTGTATPVVGDTALGTEAGRVAMTSFVASGSTVTASATFPAGTGIGAITEAAIMNAGTAGTLLCRTVFPVVNKASADSFSITWAVTIS